MLLLFSTFVFYPQHLFTFRERRKDWRTCDKKSLCNNVKKKKKKITLFWCYWYHFIHTVVFVLYFSHISKLWYMLKAAFVLFCLLFAYYSIIGSVSRWSRGCDFRHQVWRDRCMNRVFLLKRDRVLPFTAGSVNTFWVSNSGQCADAVSSCGDFLAVTAPLLSRWGNARVPESWCDCMCHGCDWILWGAKTFVLHYTCIHQKGFS